MNILTPILALLPGFAWLLFYLQEDLHPEPKKLIGLTFIAGMASAFFALAIELIFNLALLRFGVGYLNFYSLLVLAFIEEGTKFSAAYLTIHKSKAFDEPVDAMIYVVAAALGFATLENIGVLTGGLENQTAIVSMAFATASLRFVGATLLHSLTSGIVGFSWAMGIRKFNRDPISQYPRSRYEPISRDARSDDEGVRSVLRGGADEAAHEIGHIPKGLRLFSRLAALRLRRSAGSTASSPRLADTRKSLATRPEGIFEMGSKH